MEEIRELLFIILFAFLAGFVFSDLAESRGTKKGKNKNSEEKKSETEQEEAFASNEKPEEILSPMTLRNGYGVTKERNPTFAEQWVNIMNYSGESQTEDGYEENDYPEGYME
ncbi:MAG: hypothetical protein IJ306_07175 [Oscillospiraceae bacterium]|nr:hypothetical protein [Oscillospiraceae bacterium]